MNEVRKLYNDDGCVLQGSPNDYESWSSARALGPMERKEEYKKMCYNFEYKFGEHVPNCALKYGKCDEDCEYMKNFKE